MTTIDQIAVRRERLRDDGSVPVILIDDLHKSFGSQRVLDGIDLTVSRGETLAVFRAQWHR